MLLTDEEIRDIRIEWLRGKTLSYKGLIDMSAKAQAKKIVEWGEEDCTEHAVEARKSIRRSLEMIGRPPVYPRHECYTCWQTLLKEAGL